MAVDWSAWSLPGQRRDPLSARLASVIEQQQQRSEQLISLIQLGIVGLFGGLYLAAPKTFGADAAFAPVPWVLGAYLGFTLVRLTLSLRGRVPGPVLVLSGLFDVALLLALIWSFHLQYEQPPGFYLKAPTLLYAFIFIALRTLRFEAAYVLVTGLAAAVGWLGLVIYAAWDSGGLAITRDYVAYMTSSAILIGAEVDKILAIVTVTLILALAIVRARRLLVESVRSRTAARDLARFFDVRVAEQITGGEHGVEAGEGRACEAAVLILDVRSFTPLAKEMPPGEVVGLLNELHALLVPKIQQHGGNIDKFLGDGILASFGAAEPSRTYAADAIRAARACLDAVDTWNLGRTARGDEALRVCAAVVAGSLVFGTVGDATRLEFTVIGAPVNLAAKLEKHTKEEQVRALTTCDTLSLAVDQGLAANVSFQMRFARRVHGIDTPVDLAVIRA